MTRYLAVLVMYLSLGPVLADAQPRKVDVPHSGQDIGSWRLTCSIDPMTDTRVCRMRHRLWLAVPNDNASGMAFEVQLRHDRLVRLNRRPGRGACWRCDRQHDRSSTPRDWSIRWRAAL